MVILLAISIWSLVFAGGIDDIPPALEAHSEDQLDGVEAAGAGIKLIREVVEGENGLLAGAPERVSVRHDGTGFSAYWTVFVQGSVRHRPNSAEEFISPMGEIVVEVSALTGELHGEFSAGAGVLSDLQINDEGLIEVPLGLVWPPES